MATPQITTQATPQHQPDSGFSAQRDRIDLALTNFLDRQAPHFDDPEPLQRVYCLIREFVLDGGKRLRPLLCYWGWHGADGTDNDGIITAAASLELFQAYALIHDDIMDGSVLRRGRPTLHRALADLHPDQPAHAGTSLAILAGDLCLTWSDTLFDACGLPPHRLRAACDLLQRMRTETILGQYLDLLGHARISTGAGSVDEALRIIHFKTAKYTVERPLQIGALLAGADRSLLDSYSAFALPAGEAFQLRDDLLGVYGDSAITGKPNLDDLREGKPTALAALAHERATSAQSAVLCAFYGDPQLDDKQAATLRGVIVETGACQEVERMITRRADRAFAALEQMPISDEARTALHHLTATLATRTH